MKSAAVVYKVKPAYGPIMNAIQKTGIDILCFDDKDEMKNYDRLIIFHNKLPPVIDTKAYKAWWMCDLRSPDELKRDQFNFDIIFTAQLTYEQEYRDFYKKPVYYMPQCGLDEQVIREGRKINAKVIFIGNIAPRYYHGNRRKILNGIHKKHPVTIIRGEGQTPDQAWLYQTSKYCLSISYPMIGGTSNRLYNILAAGGFALVSYFPGIEKLFVNGKHLCWFHNVEEAIDLIDYYDRHEELYKRIRREGKQIYNERHTAAARLQNMFDIIDGKTTSFYGYIG